MTSVCPFCKWNLVPVFDGLLAWHNIVDENGEPQPVACGGSRTVSLVVN